MRKVGIICWIVLLLMLSIPVYASAKGEDDLKKADADIQQAIQLAQSGKVEDAFKLYDKFQTNWLTIEDGIKVTSLAAYQKIEGAMGEVSFAALKQPIDQTKLIEALKALHEFNANFISGKLDAFGQAGQSSEKVSIASLVALLETTQEQLKQSNFEGAKASIQKLRSSWLDIEGIVLTQSSSVYTLMERDMVTAYALLSAEPINSKEAAMTVDRMHEALGPLAGKTSYTMLDATTILLREGLEALHGDYGWRIFCGSSRCSKQRLLLGTGFVWISSLSEKETPSWTVNRRCFFAFTLLANDSFCPLKSA
ncbi:hypothetical protein [Paenibacillus cremeus]|uniref:SbsC C-terminal domain-containing protein n=1 Tax=Paenibacillus cremeus TaxID=2163881 RepID=A0A559JHR6_9BACL|nr:hypothetical protein [Paenibacillus cremeus]TVX99415.1 hypothetical protein FPZ49_33790 [Paenibacillus cremeus]